MPVFNPDDVKRLPSPEKFQTSSPQPAAAQATSNPSARGGRFMDGWNTGPNHTAGDETRARARAEGAQWQAEQERARQARANAAQPAQSAPRPTPNSAGFVAKGRSLLNKGVGGRLGAAGLLSAAIQPSFDEDSTQRYAKRFGVNEPTGDGSMRDIAKFTALRAGGFATDLADTLTFGQASRLYRDNEQAAGNPAGAELMGNVVGAATGWHGMPTVGKAVDKTASLATRGKYKGDVAEKALSNKYAKTAGLITGGTLGGALSKDANNAIDSIVATDPQQVTQEQQNMPAQAGVAVAPMQNTNQANNIVNQANNIVRDGNSFSANGPITEGFTMNGETYNPKSIYRGDTQQNQQAVQNLLDRTRQEAQGQAGYPQQEEASAKGFNKDRVTIMKDTSSQDRLRRRLENMVAQGRTGDPKKDMTRGQYEAITKLLDGSDNRASEERIAGLNNSASIQQEQMRNEAVRELEGARGFRTDRELDLKESIAQADIARNNRVTKLYEQYDNAKTPEERSQVAALIQQLGAKSGSEKLKDNYMVVGGGQEWDENAGLMRNVPQTLIDLRTGMPVNASNQNQEPTQFENGKYYQDKDGNVIYYQDGRAIPYN